MARPKKPEYEYVPTLSMYRKRVRKPNGKYIALYGSTPAELENRIADYYRSNLPCETEETEPLVNDYIDSWFLLTCGHLSDNSKRDYGSIIKCHIKPYFEGMHMSDVYPKDITAALAHTLSLSEAIHNKTNMILKRVFTFAYDNGDIPENPCPKMHNGGRPPKEKVALTAKQKKILLDAVIGTRAHLFCLLGLYAGLRSEEILGLQWDCVHLDEIPRIDVRRATRFKGNIPYVNDTLKSPAARRTIPIPDQLVDVLKKAKADSESDFVFSGKTGGPYTKMQLKRLWDIVNRRRVGTHTYYRYVDGEKVPFTFTGDLGEKSKSGNCTYTIYFPVTPHILRHTYISDLIAGGMDIKTAQYLAGHEKSKTTLDIYTHMTYNKSKDILAKVDKVFENAQG